MSDELIAAWFKGMALGASLIIAIGAQNAFVIRQGLKRQGVFLVATICLVCDIILIGIGAAGIGTAIASSEILTRIATWGGAAFLLFYGLRAFRAALKPGALNLDQAQSSGPSWRALAGTTLALTLLNPHVYLDTVVLLGSLAGRYETDARLAFTGGAWVASAIWFYTIGFGAAAVGPWLAKPVAWRIIDLLVATVMWVLALTLLWPEVSRMVSA